MRRVQWRSLANWTTLVKKRTLAATLAITSASVAGSAYSDSTPGASASEVKSVQFQQIRNATVKVTFGKTEFLIDPMLAKKGTYPGFPHTFRSELRNPLVDLPQPVDDIMQGVDAVIVTHTHLDHWDDAAQAQVPKHIPLFTQHEADAELIRSQGFTNVRVLSHPAEFEGIRLTPIGGQHGTDEMYAVPEVAERLGEAMGVVFEAPGFKTLYLAGDTVWRPEVDASIQTYHPQIIVLNAGMASLTDFAGGIIMGKEDVLRASRVAPTATIVASHLDAINHMTLTRKALREFVDEQGIHERVQIPEDGVRLKL